MTTTKAISHQDIIELANKIAKAHIDADRGQLADGQALTADGPVGYRTGVCNIEDDIAAEWCGEDEAAIAEALALADAIESEIVRTYNLLAVEAPCGLHCEECGGEAAWSGHEEECAYCPDHPTAMVA